MQMEGITGDEKKSISEKLDAQIKKNTEREDALKKELEQIRAKREQTLQTLEGLKKIKFLVEENNYLASRIGKENYKINFEELLKDKTEQEAQLYIERAIHLNENFFVVKDNKFECTGVGFAKYPKEEQERLRAEWREWSKETNEKLRILQEELDEEHIELNRRLSAMTKEERIEFLKERYRSANEDNSFQFKNTIKLKPTDKED